MVHFSEGVKMYNFQRRNSAPLVIHKQTENHASSPGLLASSTMFRTENNILHHNKGASNKATTGIQFQGRDPKCSENHFHWKCSRRTKQDCVKINPNPKHDRTDYHTALADTVNPEVKTQCRCSNVVTALNLFADHTCDHCFKLPPLPQGSLTFQLAMRDLKSSCDVIPHETVAKRDGMRNKCPYGTRYKLPRLAWYGPLVDYKGRQVYLSTRNYLNTIIRKPVHRKWCF